MSLFKKLYASYIHAVINIPNENILIPTLYKRKSSFIWCDKTQQYVVKPPQLNSKYYFKN
jgi:hypothetical protein